MPVQILMGNGGPTDAYKYFKILSLLRIFFNCIINLDEAKV